MSARAEKADKAARLRAAGMTIREVAATLGVSRSYAASLLSDPDGAKDRERKRTYRGSCLDCGAPTDGSNGRTNTSVRCARCAAQNQHDNRHWTRERIIEAFRRYHAERGCQPSASECLYARPGPWFPAMSSVIREFGSWSAAIRECGWTPWTKRNGGKGMAEYVMLKQNGDGGFHKAGQAAGKHRDAALRAWLASLPEAAREGVWATVPASQWMPRHVRLRMKPVLVFDAGEQDAA